jgi:hypothetical protein
MLWKGDENELDIDEGMVYIGDENDEKMLQKVIILMRGC